MHFLPGKRSINIIMHLMYLLKHIKNQDTRIVIFYTFHRDILTVFQGPTSINICKFNGYLYQLLSLLADARLFTLKMYHRFTFQKPSNT